MTTQPAMPPRTGLTRRQLLQRGAAVGGGVLAAQSLGVVAAFAQTSAPPPATGSSAGRSTRSSGLEATRSRQVDPTGRSARGGATRDPADTVLASSVEPAVDVLPHTGASDLPALLATATSAVAVGAGLVRRRHRSVVVPDTDAA